MWYTKVGILLATVVVFHSIWITIFYSFSSTVFGDFGWRLRDSFIPVYLLLTVVLYFSAVKNTDDPKDAAKRAAIAGGITMVLARLSVFVFALLEVVGGFTLSMLPRLLQMLAEGPVVSAAAAATAVAAANYLGK